MGSAQCLSSSWLFCRAGIARYGGSGSGRLQHALPPPSFLLLSIPSSRLLAHTSVLRTRLCAAPSSSPSPTEREEVFFDGGPHIGDLLANLVFGLTLLWLPLTLASVFRCLFLRYRFTNLRVTVMSGLAGSDRKDFSYKVIKDVKYVPRFIGEWGDVIITLTDGTQVELKSVPRFREIARYCLERAGKDKEGRSAAGKGLVRLLPKAICYQTASMSTSNLDIAGSQLSWGTTAIYNCLCIISITRSDQLLLYMLTFT